MEALAALAIAVALMIGSIPGVALAYGLGIVACAAAWALIFACASLVGRLRYGR